MTNPATELKNKIERIAQELVDVQTNLNIAYSELNDVYKYVAKIEEAIDK